MQILRKFIRSTRLDSNLISSTLLTRALFAAVLIAVPSSQALDLQLPEIGSANSSDIQFEQEYELGQAWVRLMRAQADLLDEPIIESYLRDQVWSLVPYSELQDKRLELLVIDNSEINAFAAPGGIVGINGGLLLAAQHEAQLMSVIAHEFAHLSQRHFAQQQSAAEKRQPLVLAGIVGSILLSGISADAGAAMLHGTVGATQSLALAYSRQHETDADQTGMRTLANAGYDPQAMPQMFALLANANRFSSDNLPEFLRTHPVTQARIADSTNRALAYPIANYKQEDSDRFLIARALTAIYYQSEEQLILEQDKSEVSNSYQGLIRFFKAVQTGDSEAANQLWQQLASRWNSHPWVKIVRIEQLSNEKRWDDAGLISEELLALYPGDYAVRRAAAKLASDSGDLSRATQIYRDLIRDDPNNTQLWYNLAELYGLQQNLVQLHRARIEFFALRGEYDLALRQIEFARRDARRNEGQLGYLQQREGEIKELQKQMDRLLN